MGLEYVTLNFITKNRKEDLENMRNHSDPYGSGFRVEGTSCRTHNHPNP